MAESNGNGSGTKLTWWILGLGASIMVLFVSLLINKFEALDRRMRETEVLNAGFRERINNAELTIKLHEDRLLRLLAAPAEEHR